MLSLQAPLYLLLLLPLAVLAVLFGRPLGGLLATERRQFSILALRCAALALLVVAISQPVWKTGSGRAPSVIFVADTSASIGSTAHAAELSWLQQALQSLPSSSTGGLVTFAGSPVLSPLPSQNGAQWAAGQLKAPADSSQTNIQQALQLGLGAAGSTSRIVLISDGVETAGDATIAAANAASRHVPVDVVTLASSRGPDAAMTRLDVPATVHVGDALPLQMTVWSNRAGKATFTLTEDGQPVGQETITLKVGDNPFLVTLTAPALGWHSYHAAIALPGDTIPQNNALDATTQVTAQPKLLIVTPNPSTSTAVSLLSHLGLTTQVVKPAALPKKASTVAQYDEVVLDDVPATDLSAAQQSALESAVRVQGVGLFVLGGPSSLTLGHYGQTTLEKMMPVLSDTPASLQQGNVALELVLDRSGSMDDLLGSSLEPKIALSRSAAQAAVDFVVSHKDQLGMVQFDISPKVDVPLQPVTSQNVAKVRATINGMTADGGTDIFKALELGLAQIQSSNAPYKHIILMTDGRSEPDNYAPLMAQMQKEHVTLSAIGLGEDADTQLLQYLAAQGKGRYYFTNQASDLPKIFAEESRLSAGSAKVEGNISVVYGASSPVIRSLGEATLPDVKGYAATVLKPGALADLVTHVQNRAPDPILAQWQYGLGRVLTWTPGLNSAWAATWLTADPSLWEDATRWALRGAASAALAPQLVTGSTPARIAVDTTQNTGSALDLLHLQAQVQAPDGSHSSVALTQVAPGRYEGDLPSSSPGVYRVTVSETKAGGMSAQALVAVPYSDEYLPAASTNQALLAQIAQQTGGKILSGPSQLTALFAGSKSGSQQDLWWPLALAALALFFIEVAIRTTGWGRAPITRLL
jgi:Mg-chelatase subunit ChlD